MRKIKCPIFGNAPTPGGRLQDVIKYIPHPETVGTIPAKADKWCVTLVRFPDRSSLWKAVEEDGTRCPASMGGGTKGMGKAQLGLKALI